jgi:hypothetical protein
MAVDLLSKLHQSLSSAPGPNAYRRYLKVKTAQSVTRISGKHIAKAKWEETDVD